MQTKSKKQRLSRKSNEPAESDTPRGVVRKQLKSRQPCRSKSRSSKKTAVGRQEDDHMVTSTSEDAGHSVAGQDTKTRVTAPATVSSATKLKLAAFSASDVSVRRCCLLYLPYLLILCYASVVSFVFLELSVDNKFKQYINVPNLSVQDLTHNI